MRDLTPRQQKILQPIRGWIEANGLPRRAETAQEFGLGSVKAAQNPVFHPLMVNLRRQGMKL